MPPQIEEGEGVFKKCASLLRDCQAQARWFAMSTKEGARPDPGGIDAWKRREEDMHKVTPLPRGPGGSGGSLGGSGRHALNVAVQMYNCGPGRVQRACVRAEAAQVYL